LEFQVVISSLLGEHYSPRRFAAHFGVSVHTALIVWNLLEDVPNIIIKPIHILWTLYFLKTYDSVDVAATRFHCDSNTYNTWVCRVLYILYHKLQIVRIYINQMLNTLDINQ
jgi:hypothetical protein